MIPVFLSFRHFRSEATTSIPQFIYGYLGEEFYVEQPEGCIALGNEHIVCRLKKPLDGLIQAVRKWNEKFDSFETELGLIRCSAVPCTHFHRGEDPDDRTILKIWMDDGILQIRRKKKAQSILQH